MPRLSRRQFGLATLGVALTAGSPALSQARGAKPMAIDEGLFVDINGLDQWITIRGRDLKNPVLLWLHGGPGFPMSGMAPVFADWEQDFTVVQWDQPGGGATHAKNLEKGEGPLTNERYVHDAISVIEVVRKRLKVKKVVLMGSSWGTALGVQIAHRRPDLVSAYVGTAQVVNMRRGNPMGYEMGLEAARKRGDKAAVAALEKVGPPPYARFEDFLVRQQYTNPPGLPPTPQEAAANADVGRLMSAPQPADAAYVARGLPQYNFIQQFMAVQKAFYGELTSYDAEALGYDFKVPMFVFQGDVDLNTPLPLAKEWFDKLRAPKKAFEVIPGAGHNTVVFHAELLRLLRKDVLPVVSRAA